MRRHAATNDRPAAGRPAGAALPVLAALLALAAGLAGGCGRNLAQYPGEETIRGKDLARTVAFLTDPAQEGRLAGSAGHARAARYAAERFRDLGLEPAGDDGYLQRLTMEYNAILPPCRLAVRRDDGTERACRLGEDFVCRGFTGGATLAAPAAFVGYGISAPELGYDDYAGIDVTGRVVVAFKPAPPFAPEAADGEEGWGGRDLPRARARAAREHGAVGLVLVSAPGRERGSFDDAPIGSVLHGPGEQDAGFPQVHVTRAVAEDLLHGCGRTLAELYEDIGDGRRPASRLLTSGVSLEIHAEYDPARTTFNVAAILPGADPDLADECLVIGAHLDHVGLQGGELLFPGANDNASGAAAVLAVAEAMVRGGVRPARSVVFVLFTGEEQGLNGARYYAEHPARPLEKTVAMFNLDCVACGDSLQVGCGKSFPRLWAIARRAGAGGRGLMVERTWTGGGADATPFFQAGVPTLYFHNVHGYRYLHLPTDRPETLNPALHEELARIVYRTAATVAAGDYVREEPAEGGAGGS